MIDGFYTRSETFETLDKLIEKIDSERKLEINKDKKLAQICEDIGLYDTMTLMDARTEQLLELYSYYSSPATPPAPFNNKVWYDTVVILNNMTPRLF